MIPMSLRAGVLLPLALLLAGCAGQPGATAGGAAAPDPVQVARQDFQTAAGQRGSLPLDVPFNGSLDIRIDFGPSTFTGFRFSGVAACEGVGPSTGVFPNSANWSGSCPGVAAGPQELTWSLSSGSAQGTMTVVARPG